MRNKKGFTLIELLAIIVVMALILITAIPKAIDIIDDSRTGTWNNSVKGVAKAINKSITTLNPDTDGYMYNVNELCSNTSKLKEIVDIENADVTCLRSIFTLTGKGKFEGKTGKIVCSNSKCVPYEDASLYVEKRLLTDLIFEDNPDIKTNPTLILTANSVNENGLYSMNVANGFGGADGITYFFRGRVENNYVSFAGNTWRIVRINEDGTVRLIKSYNINKGNNILFSENDGDFSSMYYSNSKVKSEAEIWYNENIGNNQNYSIKVSSGNYFCESMKVKSSNDFTTGNATAKLYSNYEPNLECQIDGNGKGLLNNKVGLITVDEAMLSGLSIVNGISESNSGDRQDHYLLEDTWNWTSSPAGVWTRYALVWIVKGVDKGIYDSQVNYDYNRAMPTNIRPVINLKADVTATGTGTQTDPYVIN